jgi:hypothetical protein
MSRAHEASPQEATEKAKAVVRRLQAALAPSLFAGDRPPDDMIVHELRAMLDSEGVLLLLHEAPATQFTDIIRRAQIVAHDTASNAEIINRLWHFMDEPELNAALATTDQDEQPMELVRLMLEGPYKSAAAPLGLRRHVH